MMQSDRFKFGSFRAFWRKKWKKNRRLILVSVVFLLVSLVFRFAYSSTHISFHQDMARDVLLMETAIEEQNWLPGYGPKASVWNFYLPPFYFQLHLLLTALSGYNPLIMMWAVTFVEAFTPVLVFLILRFITSSKNALLAATIYLFSATVVQLGTRAWNPNMIPFFTALIVFGLLHLITRKKRWGAYLATIGLLIGFQLHYQVVLILPFVGASLLFAWYKKFINLKDVAIISAIALLSLSTYLYAELTSNWQNTSEIIEYFSVEHSRYFDQVSKPDFVLKFLPGFIERVLFGVHSNYVLGRIILFAGLFSLIWAARKNTASRIIAAFILSTFVMLRVYKGDKTDYYLSTLFMLPAILLAATMQFNRIVGFLLALVVSATLFTWMQKTEYANDFVTIEPTFAALNATTKGVPVQFLFHTDDDINVFAYGLKHYGKMKYDQSSNTILEICNGSYNCSWNGISQCSHDRSYTYISLLKDSQNHTQSVVTALNKYYVISSFDNTIQKPNYPLYVLDTSYGTDTLLPEAYNW